MKKTQIQVILLTPKNLLLIKVKISAKAADQPLRAMLTTYARRDELVALEALIKYQHTEITKETQRTQHALCLL